MLIGALAVTLVGFILLVVALVLSSVSFAWACIAVCIVGFVLLIIDVVRGRGASGDGGGNDGAAGGEPGEGERSAEADEAIVDGAAAGHRLDQPVADGQGAPAEPEANPWGPPSESSQGQ